MKLGISMKTILNLTKIDKWFLEQIWELIEIEKEIGKYKLETIPADLMRTAKEKGYADRQIAHLIDCKESEVHNKAKGNGYQPGLQDGGYVCSRV
jgi:carbamoyl-phosphate synthase large subunit